MKRKSILMALIICLVTTGCLFGDVGSGYITKTCTRTSNYEDVVLVEEREVKSKENNVISIIFTNTLSTKKSSFTFKSFRNSYISEMNSLKESDVEVETVIDEETQYQVIYNFDKIDDSLKQKYDFERLNHNQIKKYEQQGYECK